MSELTVAVSLVTYHNQVEDLELLMNSFIDEALEVLFYVWDNSENNDLEPFFVQFKIVDYHYSGDNIGFGAGHNGNLNRVTFEPDYFLVVNPDIYFEKGTLSKIVSYANQEKGISQLMPLVKYPDGQLQKLCKQLPTPFDLLIRRFVPFNIFSGRRAFYEMDDFSYDEVREIPFLSGCFSLIRMEAMQNVGGYDERFFMYMEDLDLCRRLKSEGDTIFYPGATVYHKFEKASYRSFGLLKAHIISAIKYFNKYGWWESSGQKVSEGG
jgi:GT2 family glycosyltransferase